MTSIFFILRFAIRWIAIAGIAGGMLDGILRLRHGEWIGLVVVGIGFFALVSAFSHVRRVALIADKVDLETLANRHRRHIEVPLPPAEAFAMVEAAVRELPMVEAVEAAADSLQVKARVQRVDPYGGGRKGIARPKPQRNQVMATVVPGERSCSVSLVCQTEGGALADWFSLDHGTNLENIDALTRALTRRIAERRRGEENAARATASDKELAEARLSMLHAQVEPHFLYNTLASAQLLTRSDPARADLMLGHLITYLRNSLPRNEDGMSTVGEELDRTQAYLEIMKIRMGERLVLNVQVPESARAVPLPTMMLQTLAENAIKHGLEPVPGGGNLWIFARERDGQLGITVADDGRGFSDEQSGTGIGLRNLRERLKLAYGDAAAFSIVANFPRGVAATLTVPARVAQHA